MGTENRFSLRLAPSGAAVAGDGRAGVLPPRHARVSRPAHAARDRERLREDARCAAASSTSRARASSALIDAAAEQMNDLLDLLGLAARIEAGALRAVPRARWTRSSSWRATTSASRRPARARRSRPTSRRSARSLAALASAALRHGEVERVAWTVTRPRARARAGRRRRPRGSSRARSRRTSARSWRRIAIERRAAARSTARRRDAARPVSSV